ncbi:hypothetical protein LDENG_00165590, partial [Lucifuga dentata]
ATSRITSSPLCCRAQRNQALSAGRVGSSQGPSTLRAAWGAAVERSSPTMIWSIRTAPSPAPRPSQIAAAW